MKRIIVALALCLGASLAQAQDIANPQTDASKLTTGALPNARLTGSYTALTGLGITSAGGDITWSTPASDHGIIFGGGTTVTRSSATGALTLASQSGVTQMLGATNFGTTVAALASGEVGFNKISASGSAPGAGTCKIAVVAGTNANTCKLIAYCGTSTSPGTVLDNIGTGC